MEIKVPDSISNEDLDPIALAYWRKGGSLFNLPTVIGISERRVEEYVEWLDEVTAPRFPDRRYPILIPETSPTNYISFERALNLRLPDDDKEFLTGDWHFETSFFGYPERTYAPLAGRKGLVNTVPALQSRGVRDMGRTIADHGIKPYDGPVWVANHYRAIADMAMHRLLGPWPQEVLAACEIDDWLWSEEDFEILVGDYLDPLRGLLREEPRRMFDAWLPTVVYGASNY